ncbi:MAG: DNA polymerase I, partial [Burkholderiales bacterium]|nr:DNA polymerase I [Burkholderiales bacterium]
MKTLLLVDGSSYLYRAFHALPDLRNARGEPTGAIYGVLNMLRRLASDYKPDYLACVFDAKGKTFRDDWYAEYKANRPAMPEDLVRQIEPLHQAVAALGWPLLMIDGVEADDVIGTLARQAAEAGMRCVVSTGDKDLTQLVNENVTLINTMNNERLDEAGVEAKFGVPPRLILDYLTLVGDSVDNVPGVDKVGPKTAVKWLSKYGSLDEVVAHAQDIAGVVGENLRRALPWLPQAKKLLTVYCDVPLPVKPEDLLPQPQAEAEVTDLFQRFGFKSWLKDAAQPGTAPAAAPATEPAHSPMEPVERRYETILDERQVAEWLKVLDGAALVAFDTETTGLDPLTAQLVGMSFCAEPGRAGYLPLAHNYAGAPQQLGVARALDLLRPWLEDAARPKLG